MPKDSFRAWAIPNASKVIRAGIRSAAVSITAKGVRQGLQTKRLRGQKVTLAPVSFADKNQES